jgi:glycosyltransferase involved in cell wall biosynthesis
MFIFNPLQVSSGSKSREEGLILYIMLSTSRKTSPNNPKQLTNYYSIFIIHYSFPYIAFVSNTQIIIPSFNEGNNIIKLLDEIDAIAKEADESLTVVVVDDGSTDESIERLMNKSFQKISVRIISLLCNLGHQAAIGQGLLFVSEQNASHAIIMDGDGEDDPKAILQLLKLKEFDVVNVLRGRRHESIGFRFSYGVYRMLFKLITKKKMNYGNFCMISSKVIEILSVQTFVHFAAFVSKPGFKTSSVNSDRRLRLGGKAKMSVTNLIHHAFKSFAEYGEELLMVFLRLFIILFVLFIITIGYIIYLKVFTDYPILGWSSTFGIGLLSSALICMGFFVIGILQLNFTQRNNVPPVKLYKVLR